MNQKNTDAQKLKRVLAEKKYFLLDMDGTLYRGNKLFPCTLKFLQKLRQKQKVPIFFTNNSSHSIQEYVQKLKQMGFSVKKEEIYSSGKATCEFIQNLGYKKVFLLGNPSIHKEFQNHGVETVDSKTLAGEKLPEAVVLAFDTTFTYQKFNFAYELLQKGLPFYATHPDLRLPVENMFAPDIGTFISAFYACSKKKPKIIGKPYKIIYRQLQTKLNCQKSEMIAFGDRLYTDIKGANDYGITSVLTLTGEAQIPDLKNSKIKPDFVIEDLEEAI